MKILNSDVLCGIATLFAGAQLATAQTPPSLDLRLYAGVNITGTTGSVYAVQATANLAQSNSWMTLVFLQLTTTNLLFVDTSAPATGSRFYRALLQNPPTNMVYIPANTFTMGSPTNEVERDPKRGTANQSHLEPRVLAREIWSDAA